MVENTRVEDISQQLKAEHKKNTVGKRYNAEVLDSAKAVSKNIQNKLQATAGKLAALASQWQKDKYVKLRETLDNDLNDATKYLWVRDSIRRHEAIINDLAHKIDNTENQCITIINQVEAINLEKWLSIWDGKIDTKEKQYLKENKWSVVLSEKMLKDIEITNCNQFNKLGQTKDVLTALSSNWNNVLIQMKDYNKNNPQQLALINKVGSVVGNENNYKLTPNQKNIVIINALLTLNNTSKTNISDFKTIWLESANAIFEFQKHYENIPWWSKADYIVGPKTIQQLCSNIGISNIWNVAIDKTYDASQAWEIDKERWYTHRQFVIEWLSTYRAYLQWLEQNMSMQMFSNADEKLDEQIKALDTAIFHITNENMNTNAINASIDKLIIDPRVYRSWIQQWSNLIFKSWALPGINKTINDLQENTSSQATLSLKNLLKNPGNFQTARQSFLSIMRTMDGSSGNLDRNSGSYADMARSEAINSKEAHNDTNIAPAIQKIKTFMWEEANINTIKTMIDNSRDENAIKTYISNNVWFTRNDPLLQQKINYLFDTDEMEQIVNGVKELIKNEWTNKIQLKKQLGEEKAKLEALQKSWNLNEDGTQRLTAIESAYANKWAGLEGFVNEAYQASIKSTISSIMEDYMVFNMMEKNDSSLWSQKNIVWLYADIKWVWWKISDKVTNIMANTTIDIGVEVVIAVAAFAASAVTGGAAWVLIYGSRAAATGAARATFRSLATRAMRFIPRLASKEWAKAAAKAVAKKTLEYWIRWAAFTGTSEALRNLRMAKDRSDYANNFKKWCTENFLSNTAMLGILKYVHGSFASLHIAWKGINLLDKATTFSKNQVVNTLKFITAETGISLVDYSTKALITDRPYSSEDLVNTIAESLAYELLSEWIWAPFKIVSPWIRSIDKSTPKVSFTYNDKPASIIIKGSEGSLVQNGSVVKKINLNTALKKKVEWWNNQNNTSKNEIKQLDKDGQPILPVIPSNKSTNIIIKDGKGRPVQDGKVEEKASPESTLSKKEKDINIQNDRNKKEIDQLKKEIEQLKNPSDTYPNLQIQKLRKEIKKILNNDNINEIKTTIRIYFDARTSPKSKSKLLSHFQITHENMLTLSWLITKFDTEINDAILKKQERIQALQRKINWNEPNQSSDTWHENSEASSKKSEDIKEEKKEEKKESPQSKEKSEDIDPSINVDEQPNFDEMPKTEALAKSRVEQFGERLWKNVVWSSIEMIQKGIAWLKKIEINFPSLKNKIDGIKKDLEALRVKRSIDNINVLSKDPSLQKKITFVENFNLDKASLWELIALFKLTGWEWNPLTEWANVKQKDWTDSLQIALKWAIHYNLGDMRLELNKQNKMRSESEKKNAENKNAEKSDSKPEITFKNNNVEGFTKVKLSEISTDFLKTFGDPKHSIEFWWNKIYVTDVLVNWYNFLIWYTNTGALRMFYRSWSESEWRSCPWQRSDWQHSKLEINWYSYETTTKLETSINNFFDTLPKNNTHKNPIKYSSKFSKDFLAINFKEMGKSISITAMFPNLNLEGAVDFFKWKTSEKIKSDYDKLALPKDFDLSQMKSIPNKWYSFKHDYLWKIIVDVVQMKWKGKSIDVHFARAINNNPDKVFITNIVYSDAKVNSFGVYDNQINAWPLTAKPIEYSTQLPEDHPWKRYWNLYADIRDLYQGMSLIKEYKKKHPIKEAQGASKGIKVEPEINDDKIVIEEDDGEIVIVGEDVDDRDFSSSKWKSEKKNEKMKKNKNNNKEWNDEEVIIMEEDDDIDEYYKKKYVEEDDDYLDYNYDYDDY